MGTYRTNRKGTINMGVPLSGRLELRPGDVAVFFGDSISTATYHWWSQYKATIDRLLSDAGKAAITWFTEAVGGETLAEGLVGRDSLVARIPDVTAHAPTVVFIQAGLNDVLAGGTPTQTTTALTTIINQLRAANPNVRLIILGPWTNGNTLPSGGGTPLQTEIRATNAAMRNIAIAAGIPYVDWRLHFEAITSQAFATSLSDADGIHPDNPEGCAWLGDKVDRQTWLHL